MDFDLLNDDDLRKELVIHGVGPCPITYTTRKLLIRKLKMIVGNKSKTDKQIQEDIEEIKVQNTENSIEKSKENEENIESFYGISTTERHSTPVVVKNLSQAVSLVKFSPGSRFKAFKRYEDAENFAKSPLIYSQNDSPCVLSLDSDPTSKFPGVGPRDFIKFRLLIEDNKLNEIRTLVNQNPKYLVTPCDLPSIVHEGCRRNALHISAYYNKVEIVEYILSTIKNVLWIANFYNYTDPFDGKAYETSQRLVDCYLNIPDKAAYETPLHIACKYGFTGVVKVLVNEPFLERNRKNSFGDLPIEIVCSRYDCEDKKDVENYIISLLEKDFFAVVSQYANSHKVKCQKGPVNNLNSVFCLIGPVSCQECQSIVRKVDKNSEDFDYNTYLRSFAVKYHCRCYEYFRFIGALIDLTSFSGLAIFEEYLNKLYKNEEKSIRMNFQSVRKRLFQSVDDSSFGDDLSMHMSKLNLNSTFRNLDVSSVNSSTNSELPFYGVFRSRWGDRELHFYIKSVLNNYPLDEKQYPNISKYLRDLA